MRPRPGMRGPAAELPGDRPANEGIRDVTIDAHPITQDELRFELNPDAGRVSSRVGPGHRRSSVLRRSGRGMSSGLNSAGLARTFWPG